MLKGLELTRAQPITPPHPLRHVLDQLNNNMENLSSSRDPLKDFSHSDREEANESPRHDHIQNKQNFHNT